MTAPRPRIESIEDVETFLAKAGYVSDRDIATALFLALRLRRPLLIEGHAGVGKTEIAKALAEALGSELLRLQCYEGLDASAALYEWNYAKQILRIRMEESSALSASQKEAAIFGEEYLLERPLLRALRHATDSPVLLIDEIDRADEEFEAFLLEVLSDYQITIPELGSIRAEFPPLRRAHLQPRAGAGGTRSSVAVCTCGSTIRRWPRKSRSCARGCLGWRRISAARSAASSRSCGRWTSTSGPASRRRSIGRRRCSSCTRST